MPNSCNITAPILIGGAGRSGTTWVLDALSHHSDMQYVPENSLAYTIHREVCRSWWSEIFLEYCCNGSKEIQTQKTIDLVRAALCELFPSDKKRWALKIIWGVESTWGVPIAVWRAIFPEALYIHCCRDPRSTIPSILDYLGSYGNIKGIPSAELQFQRGHIDMFALQEMGLPYLLLKQENIAKEPEVSWEKICEFCQLPAVSIPAHELQKPRATKRTHPRPPIDWNELSSKTVEIARKLGYTVPAEHNPPFDTPVPGESNLSIQELQQRIGVLSTENLELKKKLRHLEKEGHTN
jgi:hypothetical protein